MSLQSSLMIFFLILRQIFLHFRIIDHRSESTFHLSSSGDVCYWLFFHLVSSFYEHAEIWLFSLLALVLMLMLGKKVCHQWGFAILRKLIEQFWRRFYGMFWGLYEMEALLWSKYKSGLYLSIVLWDYGFTSNFISLFLIFWNLSISFSSLFLLKSDFLHNKKNTTNRSWT